ncbi:MAG TPA: dihydropteroate synthase [Flavitalea sp.]|nr:dihydropteroate synthase [Flavitalea sp.]
MYTLNCKGSIVTLVEPVIMGILNITPDSFYAASRISNEEALIRMAEKMIRDGAFFLDIGGQSTRPGSIRVSADQELQRVIPAIELLHKHFPATLLSVDTYYANVARLSVQAGASMVNDISAGALDTSMLPTVGRLQVPYVCMHMRGAPDNMQQLTHYENVTRDVVDFFIKQTAACINSGIHDIILDPGFGFGKTAAHNFQLLRELRSFSIFNKPILVGLSRKSTVYKTLGIPVEDSLNGTTVLHTLALLNGANILRVHDVKEAQEAVQLVANYHMEKPVQKIPG